MAPTVAIERLREDPRSLTVGGGSVRGSLDHIVLAIDQPWGVVISDLTVRATGDAYLI